MERPLISVLMPVYNSEKYLSQAIESILQQTYVNFEFLIFDDGSTDQSQDVISFYAAKDKRIKPFYNRENLGYVVHLNQGILISKGNFIARMDSDDISSPDRLYQQVHFLQKNPDTAVVGSSTLIINELGQELEVSVRHPSRKALFWQSFFTNPLAHPTVMFRKSVIVQSGLYDPAKLPAEDLDLWTRVLKVSSISNIEKPLLKYRQHPHSISRIKGETQETESIKTTQAHWLHFCNRAISKDHAMFFRNFHKGFELSRASDARQCFFLLLRLYVLVTRKYGFVAFVEKDAFGKLLYITLRSLRYSYVSFVQLSALLFLIFPLKSSLKLLNR